MSDATTFPRSAGSTVVQPPSYEDFDAVHRLYPTPQANMTRAKVGIGIVTYRRPDYLDLCLSRTLQYSSPPYDIVVASDDVDDVATKAVCARHTVKLISASNRGVVRNKNRLLLHFMERTDSDVVVLLEDDTSPTASGWLEQWIEAAHRWHHVNFASLAIRQASGSHISGSGSPADPYLSTLVTGQCTAVTREAIEKAGYLDPQFRGYGHGHVEWSIRHARMVFDKAVVAASPNHSVFYSIVGDLEDRGAPTFADPTDIARNGAILSASLFKEPSYRAPWQTDEERAEIYAEIDSVRIPEATAEPAATASTLSQRRPSGYLDSINLDGAVATLRGWALSANLTAAERFKVLLDGEVISDLLLRRVPRPDVEQALEGADKYAGFEVRIPFVGLSTSALAASEVGVEAHFSRTSTPYRLPTSTPITWPGAAATSALAELRATIAGKNLYFGNLPVDEPQFAAGTFVGLSLRKGGSADVVQNAYDPLPAQDDSVRLVQSQDVFEHLEYDRLPAVLNEIYRVLQPGGKFRLSLPDYRSPVLRKRSVFDDGGNVIADLMMGMSVRYDPSTRGISVTVLENGDSHLWFPDYDNVTHLIGKSDLTRCRHIKFYHYWKNRTEYICEDFPDDGMHVKRAPPFDMRADGKPVSLIVDFIK